MRIFSATLATETNTFSPIPTGLDAYRETFFYPAGEHPDAPSIFTAPLWAARQRARQEGWQLSEGLSAFAMPAGLTTRAAYETLRDQILDDLRRALPVDIVLLGLHGAMVADGYEDCEGDLLARVRAIAGPRAVIGGELDPHCHLTQQMLDAGDFLVCFKEYPHIDFVERAHELLDLCVAAAQRRIAPVKAVYDCRMTGVFHTPGGPMREFVDRIKALEGRDGILHVTVAQSFPWGDVPDMGTKILVYADRDRGKAERLAQQLGRELFALRGRTSPPFLSIDEALDRALAAEGGPPAPAAQAAAPAAQADRRKPIVIADSGDNSGGGAGSDSTFVLRRLLERGIGDVALGPLWDPVAVRFCFQTEPGARLQLRIGGKVGPLSGDPLDAEVEVMALARDLRQSFGPSQQRLGDAARVKLLDPRAPGIEIVLNTHRAQAMGRELFTGLGLDPADKRLLVLKSSQHFHAAFAPIARAVFYIGGPGVMDMEWGNLSYRRIARPKWPFDENPFADAPE
jgi:microcystin degradation protein MlrC